MAHSNKTMDITIRSGSLPHIDPALPRALYCDASGVDVRNDLRYGGMR